MVTRAPACRAAAEGLSSAVTGSGAVVTASDDMAVLIRLRMLGLGLVCFATVCGGVGAAPLSGRRVRGLLGGRVVLVRRLLVAGGGLGGGGAGGGALLGGEVQRAREC